MPEQTIAPGEMLQLAEQAAQLLLENGAETYRVEDTTQRLCRAYGYPDADTIALSTGVMLSLSGPEGGQATIRRVRKRGMNLSRINAVNTLSRQIADGGVNLREAREGLCGIEQSPGTPVRWMIPLAGLAAGSFALMFGGGLLPCVIALVCGMVAQGVTYLLRRADLSLVLSSLAGGLACALITMAAFFLFHMSAADVETTLAGAIMPLISGLMMTNAVRDTLRGDLLSGMARSVEALLVAVMVALGISLPLGLYLPGDSDVVLRSMHWGLAMLYAGLATLCFCPLLHVPGRAVVPASLLGAAAYGGYLLLHDKLGAGEVWSLFLASVAVAVLCDLLARRMRMIATIFLCVALIPLVPGLGLYRTMRALLLGEYRAALGVGLQTLFAIGAIALGAAIGSIRLSRPERVEKA